VRWIDEGSCLYLSDRREGAEKADRREGAEKADRREGAEKAPPSV